MNHNRLEALFVGIKQVPLSVLGDIEVTCNRILQRSMI